MGENQKTTNMEFFLFEWIIDKLSHVTLVQQFAKRLTKNTLYGYSCGGTKPLKLTFEGFPMCIT